MTFDLNAIADSIEAMQTFTEMEEANSVWKLKAKYGTPWSPDNPIVEGPYPYQVKWHNAGAKHSERAILSSNRIGKTLCASAECAIHLTGLYPPWWEGKRFHGPTEVLAFGQRNIDAREINQKYLVGEIDAKRQCTGTGWIPKHLIGSPRFRQCGVVDVIDHVKIKHVTGGWSTLYLQSYEQGASAVQGFTRHICWLDEEPENDDAIFPNVQSRLLDHQGHLLFTRTPELGMTPIVEYFWNGSADSFCINVGMADAPHFSKEEVDGQIARLERSSPHLIKAKIYGIPEVGSGAVFGAIADDAIRTPQIALPDHFRRIAGVDFGIDHPATCVWGAHDADTDIVYIYDAYRQQGQTPMVHAQAIKARGERIPVAWPHDGLQRDKGSAKALKDIYRDHGVNMLPRSARFDEKTGGGQSKEAAVSMMLERMHTGRLLVFEHLSDWFEEKRRYHRDKKGQIVPLKDDLLKATMYLLMDLRCAVSGAERRIMQQTSNYARQMDSYDPLAGV